MCAFLFTLLPTSLKVGSTGLICEKVKECPVLYNKQVKGYREKDVVINAWNAGAKDIESIENGKSKLSLFCILYLA